MGDGEVGEREKLVKFMLFMNPYLFIIADRLQMDITFFGIKLQGILTVC